MPSSPKTGASSHKKPSPDVDELLKSILTGDTTALARAITLMESTRDEDRENAWALIEQCPAIPHKTIRLGITGVPGVGKSTFIEALGILVTGMGKKVAVLAVDPSSSESKGSILGDKTRMQELGKHPLAFIRPSPTGGNLGGVAGNTREAILLCEAAGFELIIVETVGVGQSETAVHSMVDFFLLLQLTGAGDELQGMKRGIIEMADAIVINKADGENRGPAMEAAANYHSILELYPPKENGWKPVAMCTSALENTGISEIWKMVSDYGATFWENGYLERRRKNQNAFWFRQTVESLLTRHFYGSQVVREQFEGLLKKVERNELSPFRAAALLIELYRPGLK